MKHPFARAVAILLIALGLAVTLAPLFRHGEIAIPIHHLLHALAVAGGVALALAFVKGSADDREHGVWLAPAILAPLVMMMLMWPPLYAYLDAHPAVHIGDHLALGAAGFVAALAGQRYRSGVGWALGILSVLMALTAAGGFGSYAG